MLQAGPCHEELYVSLFPFPHSPFLGIVFEAMRPRVVVIGAGFGGLACAKRLAGKPVDVLLLDRNNYHLFTPLLYQVASSLLNPSDIAYPVRAVFRGAPNVRFRVAEVTGAEGKVVLTTDAGSIPYDYLVVATGSADNF